jgi:DNA-binding Xre family transcriptional regulator
LAFGAQAEGERRSKRADRSGNRSLDVPQVAAHSGRCYLSGPVTDLFPHLIRHACATHTYERGMPLWEIQKVLGHDWATTALRYMATAHADPEAVNLEASSRAAQRRDGQRESPVKWNLRMVAAQRDLWRPTEVLAAFQEVGFNLSLSKVAALSSCKPVTVRLGDLVKMCAALNCTVADLLQAEPLASNETAQESGQRAVGAEEQAPGPVRPVPRSRKENRPRSMPPN